MMAMRRPHHFVQTLLFTMAFQIIKIDPVLHERQDLFFMGILSKWFGTHKSPPACPSALNRRTTPFFEPHISDSRTLGLTNRSKSRYAILINSRWFPALKAISSSSARLLST